MNMCYNLITMKRLQLGVAILISIVTAFTPAMELHLDNYAKVYQILYPTRGAGYIHRRTSCVVKYAKKYKLDPIVMARLQVVESSGRWWLRHNSDVFGLYGIDYSHWSQRLWYIDDGALIKKLSTNKIENYKYLKRIGYNTEIAAYALRWFINTYGGYEQGLYRYGGFCIKGADADKGITYVDKVMRGY